MTLEGKQNPITHNNERKETNVNKTQSAGIGTLKRGGLHSGGCAGAA